MLHNSDRELSGGMASPSWDPNTQICKPDFERLIREAKDRIDKTRNLSDAIFDYIGTPEKLPSPLAEMIGELIIKERYLNSRIASLIAEQEKYETQQV